jgi:hydroxypyruvate isomerase
MPIKQSYCWPMLHNDEIPLETLIATTAEIGYAAIEVWGREGCPFDDILKYARKHGLVVASFSGGSGWNDPKNHDRLEKECKENIDIAADNGVPGIIMISGNRNGMDDLVGLRNCAEGLKRVAPHAEAKGVNLNMELLNSKVDHLDYMCDRTQWAVTLCELVGSPRVKILYDIYHMAIQEGDLIRTIRTYGHHIGHYHTAGNPGRRNLDDQQEIYYPAVMRAIVETGYDLYVGHEFSPKGGLIEGLRQAFEACNV